MPAIMIQGCGSDVGKSLLVAGLCRLLSNRGHSVRPFKPQNMSNNAAVTAEGGEIGRSTWLQARACRVPPSVRMNPVLLKPQSETGAQLIVLGRREGEMAAPAYAENRGALLEIALDSYRSLAREAEWIVVEGAGSPAETNLRAHDIANMGFAHAAEVPVVLAGDIHRGHVIASLIGAHAVLSAQDRARIRGFIINKFSGEPALFAQGIETIAERTGWQPLGIVPYLGAARDLPAEDAMQLEHRAAERSGGASRIKIGVLRLPHIANFDDFDALAAEPGVELEFLDCARPLPLDAQLLILPGSKSTLADLELLHHHGMEHELHAYLRRGGRVLGICAGYQMLGRSVRDPLHIEGSRDAIEGFALLEVETELTAHKMLREVRGVELATGAPISGYEMHVGRTQGAATAQPMLRFEDGTHDGAISLQGRIMGCHLHGLFSSTAFRAALIASLGGHSAARSHAACVEAALDQIAAALERSLDLPALFRIAGA